MKRLNRLLPCRVLMIGFWVFLVIGCRKNNKAVEMGIVIGQPYQGGIIAYIFKAGDSGYFGGQATWLDCGN